MQAFSPLHQRQSAFVQSEQEVKEEQTVGQKLITPSISKQLSLIEVHASDSFVFVCCVLLFFVLFFVFFLLIDEHSNLDTIHIHWWQYIQNKTQRHGKNLHNFLW